MRARVQVRDAAPRKDWPSRRLLGNFPEGWTNRGEAAYLNDLATVDLTRFTLE